MNRLVRPINFGFEADIVNVFAKVLFGAAGAPTLQINDSKGVCNFASSTQVWKCTTHSNTSVTAAESLFGVFNGMSVTGSGIPGSTVVSAVNPGAGTFTLSNNASTSLTGTPLTFSGGQYVLTFGSQYTPFKRLDNYVKLLQLTHSWDIARLAKLLTASTPVVPAAPNVFLLSDQVPLANQSFVVTGTTATSTAVTALATNGASGVGPGQITPGMLVSGSGVAAGTYVEKVSVSGSSLTLSTATSTSVTNNILTITPINPSSLIIQCGGFTSETLTMASYTPAGTNDSSSPPIFTGTPATLTGTVSAPAFIAANPASGEILRLGLILSRSNAQ